MNIQPSRARLAEIKQKSAQLDNTGADKNSAPGVVDALDAQTNRRLECDAALGFYSASQTTPVSQGWFKSVTHTTTETYTESQGAVIAGVADRTETRYKLFGLTLASLSEGKAAVTTVL